MKDNKHIEIQNIGNKRPFSVPENYFDNFAVKMDDMVAEAPVKSEQTRRLRPWFYGAAASIIGIVLLGQVYLSNTKNDKLISETYDTYVLSQVSESSIIDYYLTSDND